MLLVTILGKQLTIQNTRLSYLVLRQSHLISPNYVVVAVHEKRHETTT